MKIQLLANMEVLRLTFRVGEASCGYRLTSSRLPVSVKEVNKIRYVYTEFSEMIRTGAAVSANNKLCDCADYQVV
jgi:hypothetical protein